VISDEHLSVLPVINNEGLYTGSISVNNIIEKLSTMAAVNEPGSVLILEVRPNDYSLSQIAQIVESNDARVLSVHIASNYEGNLDVTLKINRAEINGVIQTIQRYGYVIKSTFQVNNFYQEDLKNRFDSLMNFLKL
jgi:ACT domain-containing protein